jgi:hypothetical protein
MGNSLHLKHRDLTTLSEHGATGPGQRAMVRPELVAPP